MILSRPGQILAAALLPILCVLVAASSARSAGPRAYAAPPAAPSPVTALSDPVNQWLPNSANASWTYSWTDAAYSPTPTLERYTVAQSRGSDFALTWTTQGLGNPSGSVSGQGAVELNHTDGGLFTLNWSSTPPPAQFPVLCASVTQCGNSLSSVYFMLIWGSRYPTLLEPLLRQSVWNTTGAASNDVASTNRYLGTEKVVVPAFPQGVVAAKVQSDITQAGALGDPYGSGLRTVWWVRGVGPVKIDFRHDGGDDQQASLQSTNLAPLPSPPDRNYFPLVLGSRAVFRYSNSRHLRTPSVQRFQVSQVVNNTARVDVKSVSGPLHVAGLYLFTSRLSGLSNYQAVTQAATRVHFPALGPASAPAANRRRFFTPFDLMAYGFGPVLPAYPAPGQSWRSSTSSRDFHVFGVSGTSRIVGTRRVHTPAGTFTTLEVQSTLSQRGFPFGSGVRLSYFAPGRGLVKLVFFHRDGSVSTVVRLS